MEMVICAIRDVKSEVFAQPWFVQKPAAAVRSFIDLVNGGDDSMVSKHPEDFQLYELGIYNDSTGRITPHELPKLLVAGDSVQKEKPVLDRRHIQAV